jgi:hypothetical protein
LAFLWLRISHYEGSFRTLKLVGVKVGIYVNLFVHDWFHRRNFFTNWLWEDFVSICFVNCLHKNLRSYSYR